RRAVRRGVRGAVGPAVRGATRCATARAAVRAAVLIGARGFDGDNRAGLRVHGDAAAVGEVYVPEHGAVVVAEAAVVDGVTGAGGQRGLFRLRLRDGGLGRQRGLVAAAA